MTNKSFFVAVVVFFGLFIVSGCSNEYYPKDTVAIIDDKVIIEEQIKDEITERNIRIKILERLKQQNLTESITSKDEILQQLGVRGEDLNKEQKRYIESIERSTISPLNENEAFNILLREEVLYKEARKQGYEVSQQSALQILKEADEQTKKISENNKELSKRYNEILAIQDEVINEYINEYGFELWNAYQESRADKLAQTMTTNRMKNRFTDLIREKAPYNSLNGTDRIIAIENAWIDYTEYLLEDGNIRIVNDNYYIETYGEPWNLEKLDLRPR